MLTSASLSDLNAEERTTLAAELGESAATGFVVHALLRGNCTAYRIGGAGDWAALVEVNYLVGEPVAFASSAHVLARLLGLVSGWTCFLADEGLARAIGARLGVDGRHVRYLADLGYLLHKPVTPVRANGVRLLGAGDLDRVLATGDSLTRLDAALLRELLAKSLAAGAMVDGQLVALATAEAPAGSYGEIGIATAPDFRRRGFAAAAAALVARQLQHAGRSPVWSTGEDNFASRRVAERLGFEPAFRRLYVIPAAAN